MSVWTALAGQGPAVSSLLEAARSASGSGVSGAMTHAWLFTGPPGSGRSVAARAFAAALQCTSGDAGPGCGECQGCRSTLAGNHPDVRQVVPEGLSISVAEMRALVAGASRRPSAGRWQVLLIEDADRLT
ncbi:MAG TPA: DNA polymerase III subunit delta', partial [Pseudonocardiaceae bacterium]|nr:DNA polymerase III subunit delta' [Pseudonocardiaceae bacterium]